MLKKHLRVRRKHLVLKKHLSDATKTLFFGCWKNTAGADKTPWMLRKPRVLKKHLLDAGKVPDAGKTPFQCWKNPQPFGIEGWNEGFDLLRISLGMEFP